jgi:hypothetical protein
MDIMIHDVNAKLSSWHGHGHGHGYDPSCSILNKTKKSLIATFDVLKALPVSWMIID